jgi:hypothetical protein
LPKKNRKDNPLTKKDKKKNCALSSTRVANEYVIGMLKRFKILSERYRLRFNLIVAIYNMVLRSFSFERNFMFLKESNFSLQATFIASNTLKPVETFFLIYSSTLAQNSVCS